MKCHSATNIENMDIKTITPTTNCLAYFHEFLSASNLWIRNDWHNVLSDEKTIGALRKKSSTTEDELIQQMNTWGENPLNLKLVQTYEAQAIKARKKLAQAQYEAWFRYSLDINLILSGLRDGLTLVKEGKITETDVDALIKAFESIEDKSNSQGQSPL